MKKILLSLGAAASIIAPVATVVACGNDDKKPGDIISKQVSVDQGTIDFKSSNSVDLNELTKGLTPNLVAGVSEGPIIKISDIKPNFPVGPKSAMHFNYSGAVGILNATYEQMLGNDATVPAADTKKGKALKVVKGFLRELLLRKDILTNNNTQNLNTQATAQELYEILLYSGVEGLSKETTYPIITNLKTKEGDAVGFVIDVNSKVTIKTSKITEEDKVRDAALTTLENNLKKGAPANFPTSILDPENISKNNPMGPNSSMSYNYTGAMKLFKKWYETKLGNPIMKSGKIYTKEALTDKIITTDVIKNITEKQGKSLIVVVSLLRKLLLRKDILTNNNTQNLNTQATAQELYKKLDALGVDNLSTTLAATDTGLTFQTGTNQGKKVMFAVDDKQAVTITIGA